MTAIRRIVVVDTMGGLGDLVLALPMLHALAASHPRAELHVVTTAPWHVLLERDPAFAAVVPVQGRDESEVRATVERVLREVRPDLAVTTSRQYGLPDLLEAGATHAVTNLWRSPPADELVDVRYCRLLAEDGWVAPGVGAPPPRIVLGDDEVAEGRRLLARLAPAGRPVLCFPDSGMAVKRWPGESWAALVTSLAREGAVPIAVAETDAADALTAAGAVRAPGLALRALAGLAAAAAERAGSGVGGDTGPVRVAAACGLQCVGLYGATVPGRYGLREPASANLLGLPGCTVRHPTAITEQECWWHARCPLSADHRPACMADIAPNAVAAALGAKRV